MRWMRIAMLLPALLVARAAAQGTPQEIAAHGEIHALRLKSEVTLRGSTVRLSDLLVAPPTDSLLQQRLSDTVVATAASPPTELSISHDRVAKHLADMGLNMARISLAGSASCRVSTLPEFETADAPAIAATEAAAPLFREMPATEISEAATLAGQIRAAVQSDLADLGQSELVFEAAAQDFLSLAAPPFDFVIRPSHGPKLGAREFAVTIRRDGRTQRTVRVGAQVTLIRQVAVATRPINIGTYVSRDALTVATREFTSDAELGFSTLDGLVGQQAARFVPQGQLIAAKDVKSVDLVKRSQPVSVEGGAGVRLRIAGVALDSGKLGESVRVRLGDSRKNRREVRGVVTSVGVVRLEEDPA